LHIITGLQQRSVNMSIQDPITIWKLIRKMKILISANEVKLALDAVGELSSRIELGKTCTPTV